MATFKIPADFNGLFGELLCLAHEDVVEDEQGEPVRLREGMSVTAFEPDPDGDGNPDELLADGVVEASPDWLACKGSRWVLRIDARGVRHRSDE
jgi:hypothetical protein